jgi:ketosteroid isomerase-like protein
MADFTAALIRRDLDAALPLLTDDVIFFYSNGTAIWGKDAFAAVMTASWARIANYTYTTLDTVWLAQSNAAAAAAAYAFSWSGLVGDQEVKGGGRGTRVFRHERGGVFRRRDAGWRIAHEHLSTGDWKPLAG